MMTLRIFGIVSMTLLACAVSYGQERTGFRIGNLMVNRTETDSVELLFSIKAIEPNVTRNGVLLLTPVVFNDTLSVRLPSLYVDRPQSWYWRVWRQVRPAPDTLRIVKAERSSDYEAMIPFEEWMNGAKMRLDLVRIRRPKKRIPSELLQSNLALEKESVMSDQEREKAWMANGLVEFIFSKRGVDQEVVAAIIAGEYDRAIARLLPLEGNAFVWNALGVVYGYNGEFEKAYDYFSKAAECGLEEALFNIDELNRKVIMITM